MNPMPVVSMTAVHFGALSSLALAVLASLAWRSEHDGIVPVLLEDTHAVIEELEGFDVLVRGNLQEPVIG
jgi:hypothetical protein